MEETRETVGPPGNPGNARSSSQVIPIGSDQSDHRTFSKASHSCASNEPLVSRPKPISFGTFTLDREPFMCRSRHPKWGGIPVIQIIPQKCERSLQRGCCQKSKRSRKIVIDRRPLQSKKCPNNQQTHETRRSRHAPPTGHVGFRHGADGIAQLSPKSPNTEVCEEVPSCSFWGSPKISISQSHPPDPNPLPAPELDRSPMVRPPTGPCPTLHFGDLLQGCWYIYVSELLRSTILQTASGEGGFGQ